MFTSLAPLSQRIERLIAETPIVDPHTHLHHDRPAAPDLAALMSYHWLQTELHAVGMPLPSAAEPLAPEERVERAIPFLARMRNTGMSWCFMRILRDLYDFHDPAIDRGNYQELCARVEAAAQQSDWAHATLRDRSNIRAVVTSLGNRGRESARVTDEVYYMLDLHYLFCPGVATDLTPFFEGRTTRGAYPDALRSILGELPATPSALDTAIRDWLDATVTGPTRFSNTFLPIETRFEEPEPGATAAALALAARGQTLMEAQIDALVRAVSWSALSWHHDRAIALQIAVGAEYFICGGKSIPRFDPHWTSDMARVFHRFDRVRFDLMMASEPMMHDICVLARQFPNVSTSGYWWHSFVPSLIEKAVALRVQIAPMTKFTGFLCDAYYAEWSYGKLQLVKKAMAAALARLVETGLLEEDRLPELLQQILHDTPRAIYDLNARQ